MSFFASSSRSRHRKSAFRLSLAGRPRPGGFALVVTLSLMVLLLVLSVGLLSISSILIRGTGLGEPQEVARANARLGLMLALAELQLAAGDDRAVTAAADIGRLPEGLRQANPAAGLTNPQPGTRYWTGVWTNTQPSALAASQIYNRTPEAALKRWLVSGGEAMPVDPAGATIGLAADGTVTSPETTVVLVGSGSAGSTAQAVDDFVAVPLVRVPANGKHPGGRYGWWVGDEGVKTRYNLPSQDDPDETTYASLGARGGGWEAVAGFGGYPTRDLGDEERLHRVLTVASAALIDGSLASGNSALKSSFHDATTDSRGLLTDTLTGGLRSDLTRYLESGFPAEMANTNIIRSSAAPRIRGPRWERLRPFHSLQATLEGGDLMVRSAMNDNQITIAPILLDFRIIMGAQLTRMGESQNYKIYPCGKVAVTLANPYSHPLRWTSELELQIFNECPPGNLPSSLYGAEGRPAFIPANPSSPAVFNNAVFTIPAGTLAPGEALAYTMTGPVVRPANSTARINIRLGPFGSSSPESFDNSIIMEHHSLNNDTKPLDVRESWTTSLIGVELRGGASARHVLRRIERLELDNAFHATTKRTVSAEIARTMVRPFPLHLFSFQISQPGMDYGALLPSGDLLGTRNSTLRTYMDFNLQATRFMRPITAYNSPPYFMETSDSLASLPFQAPGGQTGSGFTRNLALSPIAWGRSPSGPKQTILFCPPEQLVSLAQFQHADLTADDLGSSVGHQPGNAVGNSYASPFVKRSLAVQQRRDYRVVGASNQTGTLAEIRNYYDLSYLLNASLWDSYFLSTIPSSGGAPLNPRLTQIQPGTADPALTSATHAASHLWIEGAFNINSTRKDAWKALLATSRDLAHPADKEPAAGTMFPRSLAQSSPADALQPTGTRDDSFSGFRRLTDQQLDQLAEEMTRQVRLRGPFVSLAHFVNRSLADLEADLNHLGRSGALQSAIDESGLNLSPNRTDSGFSRLTKSADQVTLLRKGNAPRACMDGGSPTRFPNEASEVFPVWAPESKDLNPGSIASILADRSMLINPKLTPEQGFRSTGIPGWLTQADVLQVIGPVITARSDTFRIRSYGEALDANGRPIARAWCEAIVQRTPAYLDPSNSSATRGADLNPLNTRFGRRFEMVSFRWLSLHEI